MCSKHLNWYLVWPFGGVLSVLPGLVCEGENGLILNHFLPVCGCSGFHGGLRPTAPNVYEPWCFTIGQFVSMAAHKLTSPKVLSVSICCMVYLHAWVTPSNGGLANWLVRPALLCLTVSIVCVMILNGSWRHVKRLQFGRRVAFTF